ncbi:MAG: LysE family translocator [Cyanobacteria bacterium]|nr:LysE family translocator [Cyanobacteriota bacterium]MDA0867882.1 LysE family translocator [Cyanobacteriota bacterium]
MSFSSAVALFVAMVVLALLPSISVMTVLARSASWGFRHGAVTSLGIVAGDIVYILLAIYGLSFLTETMGGWVVFIKYLGAVYLIGLGLSLWRSRSNALAIEPTSETALVSSFLAGFLLTLGDQKAVLFYLSFFPAFVDLSRLSFVDTGIVVAIAITAVGGVKLGYALLADRASSRL